MDIIHTHNTTYTLNFAPGDEVLQGLRDFAVEHGIRAAHLTGLGAAREVDVAYYNLDTKEYERTTITEDVEIISLNGNIGIGPKNATIVHLHGMFGRRDLSTFGGHIFSLTVSGAGELHVTAMPGTIHRAYDEVTGLTLMCEAADAAQV